MSTPHHEALLVQQGQWELPIGIWWTHTYKGNNSCATTNHPTQITLSQGYEDISESDKRRRESESQSKYYKVIVCPIEMTYYGCEWRSESKVQSTLHSAGVKEIEVRLYCTIDANSGRGQGLASSKYIGNIRWETLIPLLSIWKAEKSTVTRTKALLLVAGAVFE